MRQIRTDCEWGINGRLDPGGSPRHRGELTPGDIYRGHQRAILGRWENIKHLTLERTEEEDLSTAA
jgi:hypothetical protein